MLTLFAGGEADYRALSAVASQPIHAQCRVNTRFGMLVPNVHEWLAGDVVLSTSSPDPGTIAILTYQAALYVNADIHQWTHVGIYDGTGYIWDANPEANVQVRPVSAYILSKASIALLRLRVGSIDQQLLLQKIEMLKAARYDMMDTMRYLLFDRVFLGVGKSRPAEPEPESVICSTFVERALRHVGHQTFKGVSIVIPADFAASPAFEFVAMRWHQLAA